MDHDPADGSSVYNDHNFDFNLDEIPDLESLLPEADFFLPKASCSSAPQDGNHVSTTELGLESQVNDLFQVNPEVQGFDHLSMRDIGLEAQDINPLSAREMQLPVEQHQMNASTNLVPPGQYEQETSWMNDQHITNESYGLSLRTMTSFEGTALDAVFGRPGPSSLTESPGLTFTSTQSSISDDSPGHSGRSNASSSRGLPPLMPRPAAATTPSQPVITRKSEKTKRRKSPDLMSEIRKHSKPEKCEFGDYATATFRDLQRHYASTHRPVAEQRGWVYKVPCPYSHCTYEFDNLRKGNLKRHIKRKHSG